MLRVPSRSAPSRTMSKYSLIAPITVRAKTPIAIPKAVSPVRVFRRSMLRRISLTRPSPPPVRPTRRRRSGRPAVGSPGRRPGDPTAGRPDRRRRVGRTGGGEGRVSEILRNMLRRKTRTGLTAFGIAIGVFALTVMGAMSEYFDIVLDGAERLGTRNIQIQPATTSADDQLTSTTVQQLRRVDGVGDVFDLLGALLSEEGVATSLGPPDQVLGVEPRYVSDFYPGVRLRAGRWLEEGDGRVIVVGSKIAAKR